MTFHIAILIGNVMIPTDGLIFFRGVGSTTNQTMLIIMFEYVPGMLMIIVQYGNQRWDLGVPLRQTHMLQPRSKPCYRKGTKITAVVREESTSIQKTSDVFCICMHLSKLAV
jgi:hypothetical protein